MIAFYNKQTTEIRIFGSVKALCQELEMKPDNLYTKFGRKSLKRIETETYIIVKTEIERSKKITL